MLFMIIETFKGGNPKPVYERFKQRGRLAPEGLTYVSSWVSDKGTVCYQIMECADINLIHQWIEKWNDLVEFEVIPVVTSIEAAKLFSA